MDIRNMNTKELKELFKAVDQELKVRKTELQKQSLQKILDAIIEYQTNYGDVPFIDVDNCSRGYLDVMDRLDILQSNID